MSDLTYAKVGGPPADWHETEVYLDGALSLDWIEIDTKEGWGIRFARDDSAELVVQDGEVATEIVKGEFRLERSAQ